MDFFQAQAKAHKRTKRLVVLFILAIVATIASTYLVVVLALKNIPERTYRHRYHSYDYYEQPTPRVQQNLWDPQILILVAGGTLLVVGGASLFKTAQLRSGGPAVAEMVGGRPVSPSTSDPKEKRLLNIVEEMAIASGIPVPAVYVLDEETSLNAFAAGLTTSDAVVTVTRGCLDQLNRDELQGVVAHEFSHILNGDMRLNIRLVSVLFGIFFLTIIGRGLMRSIRFAGGGRSKRDGRIVIVVLIAGLALLVIGYISYFFGRLIQAAVSRQREFLADASAVQFTRNPGGIAGALKKIGGFSLGSHIHDAHATAISHFFFAESTISSFVGIFATHPPLDERIRAIEPQFDGKYTEPTEMVDIAKESFVSAGLVQPPVPTKSRPVVLPQANVAANATAALATIGTLTPEQVANAQTLIDEIPVSLRQAARSRPEAIALIFSLLLDNTSEDVRKQQLAQIPASFSANVQALTEPLASLKPQHKLPLCQLALPALREIPDSELSDFFATIDTLIKADGQVSTFEFALQKLLNRQLILSRTPKLSLGAQVYSFQAMREPILVVLSAMARASSDDPDEARRAFAAGLGHLKNIEGSPELFAPEMSNIERLDAALDKLTLAAGPIKQRLLLACAQAAGADGQLRIAEAELLRAVAACLDCPMPPISLGQ